MEIPSYWLYFRRTPHFQIRNEYYCALIFFKNMPHITRELLRKRSEHNESIISTLEELTLHQEELEGATCSFRNVWVYNSYRGLQKESTNVLDLHADRWKYYICKIIWSRRLKIWHTWRFFSSLGLFYDFLALLQCRSCNTWILLWTTLPRSRAFSK